MSVENILIVSSGEVVCGLPLEWDTEEHWVAVWHPFGKNMLTERRAEIQAWLGDVVNRFVNTFRPRIEAALRDQ